jgi:hypothetical protein
MAYKLNLAINHGSVIIEANDDGLDAIEESVKRARTEGSGALTSSIDDPNGISALLIKRAAV